MVIPSSDIDLIDTLRLRPGDSIEKLDGSPKGNWIQTRAHPALAWGTSRRVACHIAMELAKANGMVCANRNRQPLRYW